MANDERLRPNQARDQRATSDSLLADILGETASEAEDELRQRLEQKKREEEERLAKQRREDELKKTAALRAIEEERARRLEADERRKALEAEMEIERLKATGQWVPPEDPQEKDTREFVAALEAAKAAPEPEPSRTRWVVAGVAFAAAAGIAAALVIMMSSPEMDPTAYPKVTVALNTPATATVAGGVRMIPPPPAPAAAVAAADTAEAAPEREERRSGRSGRRDRSERREREATADAAPAAEEERRPAVDLSLDGASLFERGSE